MNRNHGIKKRFEQKEIMKKKDGNRNYGKMEIEIMELEIMESWKDEKRLK